MQLTSHHHACQSVAILLHIAAINQADVLRPFLRLSLLRKQARENESAGQTSSTVHAVQVQQEYALCAVGPSVSGMYFIYYLKVLVFFKTRSARSAWQGVQTEKSAYGSGQ